MNRYVALVLMLIVYFLFITFGKILMFAFMFSVIGYGSGLEGAALVEYIDRAELFYFCWHFIPAALIGLFAIWCAYGLFGKK